MKRYLLVLAGLAAAPLMSGCAVMQHLQLVEGVSSVPYQNHQFRGATLEGVGFTVDRLPNVAFTISADQMNHRDLADFVEPKCERGTIIGKSDGCRPDITAVTGAYGVQYRWHPTQRLHPLAAFALGKQFSGYGSPQYNSRWQRDVYTIDSLEASWGLNLAAGEEVNFGPWVHLTVLAGYRQSLHEHMANGAIGNSGFTVTSLLLVGKPYRDR